MAGLLDGVDQRTNLVGRNRMELLLFRLRTKQRFGINVFKVQEVIKCPRLTSIPHSHRVVRGVATMRSKNICVIDLGAAIGGPALANPLDCFVIVSEYNRLVQGFLVNGVDRIINIAWDEIHAPPSGTGKNSYVSAVTRVDNEIVEILDVEKVLSEVVSIDKNITIELDNQILEGVPREILVVDDSVVARKQIIKTLQQIGFSSVATKDGREALNLLLDYTRDGKDIKQKFAMVVSDLEMPEMDGYTLATEIRKHEQLKSLHVILHTSLSGMFNQQLVMKAGADQFIPKFNPDDLARAVLLCVQDTLGKKQAA